MRIQRSKFLLTLTLKNSENTELSAYGSDFEPLTVERNGEQISISTQMPNRVILVLSSGPTELVNMSLAGLPIDNTLLANIIEYKPNVNNEPKETIQSYLDNPSTKTTEWNQGGCVIFDLFNPNPFAYHMFIGNRIRF